MSVVSSRQLYTTPTWADRVTKFAMSWTQWSGFTGLLRSRLVGRTAPSLSMLQTYSSRGPTPPGRPPRSRKKEDLDRTESVTTTPGPEESFRILRYESIEHVTLQELHVPTALGSFKTRMLQALPPPRTRSASTAGTLKTPHSVRLPYHFIHISIWYNY